ncbi:putative GEM-like protein 8 [Oryza brachyantha]|uniref:GRAM domain-containing protein n=1 Tax=Oryza brachyantha TaxID=4533 RepID=J3N3L4_ORYBR|nr:putative GEM-like protein 8 [Oryza brachyantha]
MEGFSQEHVTGIPLTSFAYADEKTQAKTSRSCLVHKKGKKHSIIYRVSKLSQKTDSYVQGFKEHITLGPNISDTLKGKLSLGAKVLQAGSIDKVFRQYFQVGEDEKLLKAFQCYLSTTAGPIAGMLFISSEKIGFHSDRPLDLTSPKGGITRVPYKVLIPAKRLKSAAVRENLYNPDEKYIDVVTVDGFDFWFMGFISYTKTFKYLQRVISEF